MLLVYIKGKKQDYTRIILLLFKNRNFEGKMSNNLQQNIQYIAKSNKVLARKIESLEKFNSKFAFLYTENKEVVLVKDGFVLNSPTEPLNEAVKLFESVPSNTEYDTQVLVGFELGYLASFFANNTLGSIIVWEPCIETLRLALEIIDYSSSLGRNNVFVVSTLQELNETIAKVYHRNKSRFYVYANEHYSKHYKEFIETLKVQFDELHSEPYTGGPLKLNIGAGLWAAKGWRTLDCYKEADFFADLREMKPFEIEDNCIEKAFSSHCIEHIKDEHIEHMFSELHRCMKPGATFRLSCPDADIALENYKKNNKAWFSWLKQSHIGEMLLNSFVSYEHLAGGPVVSEEVVKEKFETLSKEEFLDWCVSLVDETRPYIAHRNALYYDKVKKMLEKAGFKNIRKSSYLKSSDPELRNPHFDKYEGISLYVECQK